MVYPDPNHVRCYRYSVNFNKYEQDLIVAIANYQGLHPAAIVRELAIAKAIDLLTLPAHPNAPDQMNTDVNKER